MQQYADNNLMIIMKGTDHTLKNTRPNKIYDLIENKKVIKNVKQVKPLRNGDYLITIDIAEKDNIYNLKNIGDMPVNF